MERARILTVFFPNERDLGVFFGSARQGACPANPLAPSYVVALLNGDGIDKYYGDVGKSACMRITEPLSLSQNVGLSVFSGRSRLVTGFERVKQALGLEYQGGFLQRRLRAQAEFLWGRAYGEDQYGGYGQIEYDLRRPCTLFVRHDIDDPNTHAAGETWNRTSVGVYRELRQRGHVMDSWRVTGEYDFVSNAALPRQGNDTFAVQLQWNHN